jgi:murein DD-endopeptidase MepM/ murein hydrolase activator NlpD
MKKILYLLILTLACGQGAWGQTLSQDYNAATRYYSSTSQQNLDLVNVVFKRSYTSVNGQNPGHITDEFMSARTDGTHKGVDYRASSPGHNVYSPLEGIVVGNVGGTYGQVCVYNATYQLTFIFLHLNGFNVSPGQSISVGQLIGKSGNTSPPNNQWHFHAEMRNGVVM